MKIFSVHAQIVDQDFQSRDRNFFFKVEAQNHKEARQVTIQNLNQKCTCESQVVQVVSLFPIFRR